MKNCILLIAALLAVSCVKTEVERPHEADGYIHVNAAIVGEGTRAIAGPAAGLSGIQFLHATSTTDNLSTISFAGMTPIAAERAATAAGAITFAAGSEPTYALSDATSYLQAYHPMGVKSGDVVTWTPDGTVDILVSELWNGGKYTAPNTTTGLVFNHVLSQIEVVCRAKEDVATEILEAVWGKIQTITLNAPTAVTYTYGTNVVAYGTTMKEHALLNGAGYAAAFVPLPVPASTNTAVTAAAMLPAMDVAGKITLTVTTEKGAPIVVPVDLVVTAGHRHTVTLTFDPKEQIVEATSTTIKPWTVGETVGNDVVTPKEPLVQFAQKPFDKVPSGMSGFTSNSYNWWYGDVTGTHNGTYQGTTTAAFAERPYMVFEVALEDLTQDEMEGLSQTTWTLAQGVTTNDAYSNVCAQALGTEWRLPRLSELALIQANLEELLSCDGMAPFNEFIKYWSATEATTTTAWAVNVKANGAMDPDPKTVERRVRCVKELPLPPTIVKWGQSPFDLLGDGVNQKVLVPGTQSYNDYTGLVSQGNNGIYVNPLPFPTDFSEPPYAVLEIAKGDLIIGNGGFLSLRSMTKRGDLCRHVLGETWRMPRASEVMLMMLNYVQINASGNGFAPLTGNTGIYWSATEVSLTNAYSGFSSSGPTVISTQIELGGQLRCVREVPPLP